MIVRSAVVGAGALAAALTLAGCSSAQEASPQLPSPTGTAPTSVSPTPAAEGSGDVTTYRDGDYSATGWYGSLPSHHDVTLTIEGDTVTAVQISTPAEDETSLGYQQRFAAALPEAIVGRDIDDLDVDRLAGSSGCSEGFMGALAQIKDAALA